MSIAGNSIFNRTGLLFGEKGLEKLSAAKVIIFGVGGVGSWCAEGLIRSGICNLTIVDSDKVCITNINRQLMATTRTIGQMKVDALKERLLEINPEASITAIPEIYGEETADKFNLSEYDYIIDAIDSLSNKMLLMLRACETSAVFFSSMGAALKVDPTRIRVAEFWEVRGCPLGAALRKKFKRAKLCPARKFLCVYDDEVLPNVGQAEDDGSCTFDKVVANGTTASVTAIFGFTLSGLVVKDIYSKLI